jgi:hypothetical protein
MMGWEANGGMIVMGRRTISVREENRGNPGMEHWLKSNAPAAEMKRRMALIAVVILGAQTAPLQQNS